MFDFFVSYSSFVGLLIVAITSWDIAVTVLVVSRGPGPITRMVSRATWATLRWLGRVTGRDGPLQAAGPVIVLLILWTWMVLMIVGWGLVFGQEGSLLQDGEALEPAWGRIHYAASLILGRGGSSFEPSNPVWRFAEQLASLVGVAFVGMAVAYVLPIISAVIQKRTTAVSIWSLGETPVDVLVGAWNGEDFGDLDLHLLALTPEIADLSQRHLAYPVLAHFHSSERMSSLLPSVVVLDETLTLLDSVVDGDLGCSRSAITPCRNAIRAFLRTVELVGAHAPSDTPLPRPELRELRDAGIPLRDDDDIEAFYAEQISVDRRALLVDALAWDGSEPQDFLAWVVGDEAVEAQMDDDIERTVLPDEAGDADEADDADEAGDADEADDAADDADDADDAEEAVVDQDPPTRDEASPDPGSEDDEDGPSPE